MSSTAPMEYGDYFVWAHTDAFAVFCTYLRDALGDSDHAEEPWVVERRERLIGSITYPPGQGLFLVPQPHQDDVLKSAVREARRRASERGDLVSADLATWTVNGVNVDVVQGPTGVMAVDRVVDVADTLMAMLEGTLPAAPPYRRWFVGSGQPGTTIGHLDP